MIRDDASAIEGTENIRAGGEDTATTAAADERNALRDGGGAGSETVGAGATALRVDRGPGRASASAGDEGERAISAAAAAMNGSARRGIISLSSIFFWGGGG